STSATMSQPASRSCSTRTPRTHCSRHWLIDIEGGPDIDSECDIGPATTCVSVAESESLRIQTPFGWAGRFSGRLEARCGPLRNGTVVIGRSDLARIVSAIWARDPLEPLSDANRRRQLASPP